MARPSQTGVSYKGGFRGSYIPIQAILDNGWPIDILNFVNGDSCIRDCESYCRMQIRIGGRLYVTWHSSEILARYLADCREKEQEEGSPLFPLEGCKLTRGEDRGYYISDCDDEPPTEDEIMSALSSYNRRKRR